MSISRDLRRDRRLGPILIRAEFWKEGGAVQEGYLTNLSAGGAFLASEDRPEVGSALSLRIQIPWRIGEVLVRASVVWSTDSAGERARQMPAGVGLRFAEVSPRAEEKLRDYMSRFYELAARIEE